MVTKTACLKLQIERLIAIGYSAYIEAYGLPTEGMIIVALATKEKQLAAKEKQLEILRTALEYFEAQYKAHDLGAHASEGMHFPDSIHTHIKHLHDVAADALSQLTDL